MKKLLRKVMVVFAAMVMVLGMTACSSKDSGSADNKVIVGFDNTFVPMGFLDEDGNTVGFDVDLAKETFKRLGMEVEFQPIDWSMKETELNSGNVDILWNG